MELPLKITINDPGFIEPVSFFTKRKVRLYPDQFGVLACFTSITTCIWETISYFLLFPNHQRIDACPQDPYRSAPDSAN